MRLTKANLLLRAELIANEFGFDWDRGEEQIAGKSEQVLVAYGRFDELRHLTEQPSITQASESDRLSSASSCKWPASRS